MIVVCAGNAFRPRIPQVEHLVYYHFTDDSPIGRKPLPGRPFSRIGVQGLVVIRWVGDHYRVRWYIHRAAPKRREKLIYGLQVIDYSSIN